VGYANDGKIAVLEHAIFHNFLWRTPSPKVAIPKSEFETMPRMTLISISCRRFKKRIEGGRVICSSMTPLLHVWDRPELKLRYDKYCLFYKSVWMMRNIIHFYNLANQSVEREAGMDGQKITYALIKRCLGDLFYRLANKDVLTGKFKKLHEDLPAGFRNLEGETQ
ncbi:V-type proton ATPase catalytic subunit A-like protein, partial [Tanacetum coccineum]